MISTTNTDREKNLQSSFNALNYKTKMVSRRRRWGLQTSWLDNFPSCAFQVSLVLKILTWKCLLPSNLQSVSLASPSFYFVILKQKKCLNKPALVREHIFLFFCYRLASAAGDRSLGELDVQILAGFDVYEEPKWPTTADHATIHTGRTSIQRLRHGIRGSLGLFGDGTTLRWPQA